MLESQVAAVYDAIAPEYADAFGATEPEQPLELAMIDHLIAMLKRDLAAGAGTRAADGARAVDTRAAAAPLPSAGPARADPSCAPRVLDAGCGAGRLLPYLESRGCQVTGIDIAGGMVAQARRRHPTFGVSVGSLTRLPLADAAFDAYVSWYSTIHLPVDGLSAALAEAARVLRPGGRVLLAFQAGHGARDVARGMRSRHDVPPDAVLLRYHRTPDEVAAALVAAGFVESARLVRGPVDAEQDPQAVLVATRGG